MPRKGLMPRIKWHYDKTDAYGFTQEWRLAIAEYLFWDLGETVIGYRPGMRQIQDSYALEFIKDVDPSLEELHYAYSILTRFREILGALGKDY